MNHFAVPLEATFLRVIPREWDVAPCIELDVFVQRGSPLINDAATGRKVHYGLSADGWQAGHSPHDGVIGGNGLGLLSTSSN